MIRELGRAVPVIGQLLMKKVAAAAIDITHRCNLRCKHCYWWEQDHPNELDDVQMVRFFRALRGQGLRAAILYGGEPALRPSICKAASEVFDFTLIFTNGTLGFPEIRGGQWILSLDGPRQINDAIRGSGVFDLAVKNLQKATRSPIVHITITQWNEPYLEEFSQEMLGLPVKGIGFSFYTPMHTKIDDELLIPVSKREGVIKRLLALREKYGEQIGFTEAMGRQLLPTAGFHAWNSYERCPVSKGLRCYKANGEPKACTYGDNADCTRCGCAAVVAFRGAFYPPHYETMRLIWGLLSPGFSPKTRNGKGDNGN
ncbi:MAG: radical SAM protein [Deltaproteobacteria bacterium]|nr:radical SAM protein [Deltaproteobacteria bacterium]